MLAARSISILGLTRQEYIDELNFLYADEAPSYSTVKNWYNEFNLNRRSLQDEFHEDYAKSAIMPKIHQCCA